MGSIAMAYPSKVVTRQVTPSPAVQQTATGPAPAAATPNNYQKPTPEAAAAAFNQLKSSGGLSFADFTNAGSLASKLQSQLNKNGYDI